MRQEVAEFDLLRLGQTELLEHKLGLIPVEFHASLDLHEIVALDVLGEGFKLIPHAGFHSPTAVSEFHAQVSLARSGTANFLFMDQKETCNGLVGHEIFDESILH
jgi:hypothetical protein